MTPTTTVLSESEMLQLWRRLKLLEPLRDDCVVERTDGVALDVLLANEMRAWYLERLLTEPISRLPLSDISQSVVPTRTSDGAGLLDLPADCLRLAAVHCKGWHSDALLIEDNDPDAKVDAELAGEALAQANPFARGRCSRPVAIHSPGQLRLYTPPAGPIVIDRLLAVTLPPDGTYPLSPFLLSQLVISN